MADRLSDGIVSVDPRPSKGFSSKLVDLLERLVVKLMHDASLPLHYLSGNFAPLRDETPPVKDLPVVHGFLPVSDLHFPLLLSLFSFLVSRLLFC